MKSKATNIALIIALVCIWGTVIYKFIGNSSDDEDYYVPTSRLTSTIEKMPLPEESFQLDGSYRDPFLGKTYHKPTHKPTHKPSTSTTKKQALTPVPKVIKSPTDWSFLVYRGDFMNEKKQHVGILTIRNRDFLAKEGEEKDGVLVLKILKDSIQVNYQNEKHYIKKAKK